jgi:hypothetical protein
MYKLHPALARILRVIASVGFVCAVLAVVFRVPGGKLTTVACALIAAIISLGVKWEQLETAAASRAAGYGLGVAGCAHYVQRRNRYQLDERKRRDGHLLRERYPAESFEWRNTGSAGGIDAPL